LAFDIISFKPSFKLFNKEYYFSIFYGFFDEFDKTQGIPLNVLAPLNIFSNFFTYFPLLSKILIYVFPLVKRILQIFYSVNPIDEPFGRYFISVWD
jgi:hypothetical protein